MEKICPFISGGVYLQQTKVMIGVTPATVMNFCKREKCALWVAYKVPVGIEGERTIEGCAFEHIALNVIDGVYRT